MLKEEGKNPFTLDSKKPTGDFRAFLNSEVRYNSLYKKYPEEKVDALFQKNHEDSEERYASYVRMAADIT
jgi:pyruvate-ferredoxin/flavodoxin oxidoreductase